jgi:hypothetical protein
VDLLFDSVTLFEAVPEAGEVTIWVLALDIAHCGRDLLLLAFYDTGALGFDLGVGGAIQVSVAVAAPRAWRVGGPVYGWALFGGPSSVVLGPHPAGLGGGFGPGVGLRCWPTILGSLFLGDLGTEGGVILLAVARFHLTHAGLLAVVTCRGGAVTGVV